MDADARTEAVELLSGSGLFGSLAGPLLVSIAQQMRRVSFPAGALIFARGDPGQELYLLIRGQVRLSICTSQGRELSFAQIEAGAVFGEISTFDQGPRTADATALTPVEAWALARHNLNDLMRHSPDIASAAIAFMCDRLRNANLVLEAIALHSIQVRLARFILLALSRQGRRSGSERLLQLNMSQGDLALLIGASRPKVNVALAALEAARVINRRGNALHCNYAALRRLADMEV